MRFLHASGGLGLVEPFLKSKVCILNYHRIASPSTDLSTHPFDTRVFSCDFKQFEEQVSYLAKNFNVISPADFAAHIQQGQPLPPHPVLITFDDGYIDNYTVAYPILRKFGLGATFFIPSRVFSDPQVGWWDSLAFSVKNAKPGRYQFELPHPFEVELNAANGYEVLTLLLSTIKKVRKFDSDDFASHALEVFKVEPPPIELQAKQWMNTEQIQEMAENGQEIGSHAHSHKILALISEELQQQELVTSKQILEDKLNKPVVGLAYPVGGKGHYTEATKRMAAQAGYAYAMNFQSGLNDMPFADNFDLNRMSAHVSDVASLHGIVQGLAS